MLNEVFSQDSEVIKMIAHKKVFERTHNTHNKENIKPLNNGVGKIYSKSPSTLMNQSNVLSVYSKGLENAETSADGFFSRNASVI